MQSPIPWTKKLIWPEVIVSRLAGRGGDRIAASVPEAEQRARRRFSHDLDPIVAGHAGAEVAGKRGRNQDGLHHIEGLGERTAAETGLCRHWDAVDRSVVGHVQRAGPARPGELLFQVVVGVDCDRGLLEFRRSFRRYAVDAQIDGHDLERDRVRKLADLIEATVVVNCRKTERARPDRHAFNAQSDGLRAIRTRGEVLAVDKAPSAAVALPDVDAGRNCDFPRIEEIRAGRLRKDEGSRSPNRDRPC